MTCWADQAVSVADALVACSSIGPLPTFAVRAGNFRRLVKVPSPLSSWWILKQVPVSTFSAGEQMVRSRTTRFGRISGAVLGGGGAGHSCAVAGRVLTESVT